MIQVTKLKFSRVDGYLIPTDRIIDVLDNNSDISFELNHRRGNSSKKPPLKKKPSHQPSIEQSNGLHVMVPDDPKQSSADEVVPAAKEKRGGEGVSLALQDALDERQHAYEDSDEDSEEDREVKTKQERENSRKSSKDREKSKKTPKKRKHPRESSHPDMPSPNTKKKLQYARNTAKW